MALRFSTPGMTEMSPVGTVGTLKPEYAALPSEAVFDMKQKQGYTPFGVEMKITDDSNKSVPWDGKSFGRIKVRGFAVAKAYYNDNTRILDDEGFFDTGDVGTMDRYGYMQITDRSKDVIKSGGEWISSIDLENLAVGYPEGRRSGGYRREPSKMGRAAADGDRAAKRATATKEEILGFLEGKIAGWWMPDDVVFVSTIPHTATGKIQKTALRDQFKDHVLPTAVAAE